MIPNQMIIKSYNPVTVIRTTLLHDVLMYASRETKITERHYALNMPSESSLNYALWYELIDLITSDGVGQNGA